MVFIAGVAATTVVHERRAGARHEPPTRTGPDWSFLAAGFLASVLVSQGAHGLARRRLERRARAEADCALEAAEQARVERELYESRQMLRLILDTIPDRVFWKDRDARFVGANRRMAEAAGLADAEQIVGLTDADMPWADSAAAYRDEDLQVMASGASRLNIERPLWTPNGGIRWFDLSKLPLTDGSGAVVGVLGVARDITQHKQLEHELVKRANHDNMTGLPNRAYFLSQLGHALFRAGRQPGALALMYFDIDHFKQVNDAYGHDVGDQVIRQFADRVCSTLRNSDFVARLGGDEFVLIVEDLTDPAMPHSLAAKLVEAMTVPLRVGAHVLTISTSIGIAVHDGAMTPGQLVEAADAALYLAKHAGRNCYRMYAR
jgi:diguanylate cyclase (GGDEF)-like protein/PAS domain S-box-containing protein